MSRVPSSSMVTQRWAVRSTRSSSPGRGSALRATKRFASRCSSSEKPLDQGLPAREASWWGSHCRRSTSRCRSWPRLTPPSAPRCSVVRLARKPGSKPVTRAGSAREPAASWRNCSSRWRSSGARASSSTGWRAWSRSSQRCSRCACSRERRRSRRRARRSSRALGLTWPWRQRNQGWGPTRVNQQAARCWGSVAPQTRSAKASSPMGCGASNSNSQAAPRARAVGRAASRRSGVSPQGDALRLLAGPSPGGSGLRRSSRRWGTTCGLASNPSSKRALLP